MQFDIQKLFGEKKIDLEILKWQLFNHFLVYILCVIQLITDQIR